ncbi:30S ribosomal protein S20 [Ehrlichia ruminantium]|uniref:Small ribosomal subunit protein bS20 n=3 Tax=Ehrlichia ruminantium TaxID=779 RepID=RS20_EHRRG|nr:30S ribosomal protein S20 [Ehrlichia ruminantium]Q5FF55.1 RecName: Full=Small ribosomal subunit protein bS20; AltName: Full=30S ribosomal protein S20 [Ehrlichia ruminantium str. Gardel]Q5HCC9.1 RecName: Full=Small ribosomal subunit protein bS20; AltName: Full=30S ribosomal protein S20 [Ehrlichia ruminantium str. Welgevonden]KYW93686.1 30S ribosomal protein S20 [Ehrlichia ruminantium]QLK50124.1 30S ribosomal protein S20 [Ehrlichia ruminantium]QLK51049.1 30S ribosomal protein S20 [Ehrlichia r
MANHPSAKKMIKVIKKRTMINRMRKSRAHNYIKKFMAALAAGNKELMLENFKKAESNLHRCVNKKIIHRNTAARKISRLALKLKTFDLQQQEKAS